MNLTAASHEALLKNLETGKETCQNFSHLHQTLVEALLDEVECDVTVRLGGR